MNRGSHFERDLYRRRGGQPQRLFLDNIKPWKWTPHNNAAFDTWHDGRVYHLLLDQNTWYTQSENKSSLDAQAIISHAFDQPDTHVVCLRQRCYLDFASRAIARRARSSFLFIFLVARTRKLDVRIFQTEIISIISFLLFAVNICTQ